MEKMNKSAFSKIQDNQIQEQKAPNEAHPRHKYRPLLKTPEAFSCAPSGLWNKRSLSKRQPLKFQAKQLRECISLQKRRSSRQVAFGESNTPAKGFPKEKPSLPRKYLHLTETEHSQEQNSETKNRVSVSEARIPPQAKRQKATKQNTSAPPCKKKAQMPRPQIQI